MNVEFGSRLLGIRLVAVLMTLFDCCSVVKSYEVVRKHSGLVNLSW